MKRLFINFCMILALACVHKKNNSDKKEENTVSHPSEKNNEDIDEFLKICENTNDEKVKITIKRLKMEGEDCAATKVRLLQTIHLDLSFKDPVNSNLNLIKNEKI